MTIQAIEDGRVAFAETFDAHTSAPALSSTQSTDASMRASAPGEIIYYQDENIRISSVSAEFGIKQHALKTYQVAEITAARMRVQQAHVLPAYSVALIGLVWGGVLFQTAMLLALGIAAVGIFISVLFRISVSSNYFLRLTTTSGERDVLMSLHKRYIQEAVEAVNKAIAT